MMYVWAKNNTTGIMESDVTRIGTVPDGCTAYRTDDVFRTHESGEPLFVSDGAGHRERTDAEIKAGSKYKSWWNAKIEEQLKALDIKRIRPVAEISDDNTGSSDKQAAKAVIKTLNEQAAALRAQILK